jgi:hypothetical protein
MGQPAAAFCSAGQPVGDAGEPDALALAARLQEVAAAQLELTVELPADFFASPQVVCRAGPMTAMCWPDASEIVYEADHSN